MPKILVLSGSLRAGSYNEYLASAAARLLSLEGAEVTRISLGDYPLPIYDADLQAEAMPENAVKLAGQFSRHHGVFIASPEYNASVAPLLKNALDWMSRIKGGDGHGLGPFKALAAGLGSASPGKLGGIRGLYHLRAVLMDVGAQVITQQCSIGRAMGAFDDDGELTAESDRDRLAASCRALMEHATLTGRRG